MVRVAAKKERHQLVVLHASLAPCTPEVSRGPSDDAGSAIRRHKATQVATAVVRAVQDHLACLGGLRYATPNLLDVQSAVYDTAAPSETKATPTRQAKRSSVIPPVAGVGLRLVFSVKNHGRGGGNAWQNLLRACCVCVNQVWLPSAGRGAPVPCAAALRVVRFTTQ